MEDAVLLGHGSGGMMMRRILDEVFFEAYAGDELRRGDDAAVVRGHGQVGQPFRLYLDHRALLPALRLRCCCERQP